MKSVGKVWILEHCQSNISSIQKLQFGLEVNRYISKFQLTDDEAKELRFEIAEKARNK